MNGTENGKKGWLPIAGMIALIVVLFIGIKLIFAGLAAVLPEPEKSPFAVLAGADGQPGSYGMRLLTQEERQEKDIQEWLERDQEWMDGGSTQRENTAFWLYRQDSDEYVLYLPGQDRTLTAADVTATEERDGDGEITLVLRVRTPEGGEETAPEEQLMSFATTSEQWRGIRVKVILDGREQNLFKLTSRGGKLYSTEEAYIGRF